MATEREYTPAEVAHMRKAGIPADRPGLGSEYPKMLYRATEDEDRLIQTTEEQKCGKTWLVQNKYDGLLCDTLVVNDIDEAEIAVADGWEDTPKAAHGMADGIAKQASAKDAEIEMLKAELAAANAKRGPGRPPKHEFEAI